MNRTVRTALLPLLLVTAGAASASVIPHQGVTFTTTYTGNVLTLTIDAAGRTGDWAGAMAINGLGIKTVGSFSGVKMTGPLDTSWAFSAEELNAGGCGEVATGTGTGNGKGNGNSGNGNGNGNGKGNGNNGKGNGNGNGKAKQAATDTAAAPEGGHICYSGAPVALTDNMVFTFVFDGTPDLGAPHLKVHFVDAQGNKVGTLLSERFTRSEETIPTAPGNGSSEGGGADTGNTGNTGNTGDTGNTDTGTPGDTGGTGAIPPNTVPSDLLPTPGNNAGEGGNVDILPPTGPSGDVPEPQTLAIIGAGLAVMGLARRRGRAKRQAS